MKLLFDENLPPRLVSMLSDIYAGSLHVRDIVMRSAGKDSDFHHRSLLFGFPPKVIWIRRGNCSVQDIEKILRDHLADVMEFMKDLEGAFLVLS